MEREERLELFREMVLCCHNLYLWVLDIDLNCEQTNCPEESMIKSLAERSDTRGLLLQYAQNHTKPLIITDRFGLMWVALPRLKDPEPHVYLLGPLFAADVSDRDLESRMSSLRIPAGERSALKTILRSLPVISQSRIFEYAIMLFYCITGERILVSDLHYQESESMKGLTPSAARKKEDVHGTYAMEQEMVRMVREGNLNYQKHMSRMAVSGSMGKLSDRPDRQMKNAVLVCIVLFSRAAIEGGLAPEIALTLTDYYFQSVEACKSMPELQSITRTMQDDFVMRVHRARTGSLSAPIREACDYIQLHLDEDPTLKDIAGRLGYSEYYLSHKFKQETDLTVGAYILRQKLARAEDLLAGTTLSVKEISEQLHFCTPSYFARQFKSVYGVMPSQWRESGRSRGN